MMKGHGCVKRCCIVAGKNVEANLDSLRGLGDKRATYEGSSDNIIAKMDKKIKNCSHGLHYRLYPPVSDAGRVTVAWKD